MKQVYKWVCRLTILVQLKKKGGRTAVELSINKVLPFTPQPGLDVEFLGMPIEASLSQVCYVEKENHFEVFMHIGDRETGFYYSNDHIKELESCGWTRDE